MSDSSAIPSPGPAEGKGAAVRRLFGSIARRYDLANHLLSGGLDFFWRRRAAKIVRSWKPARIMDLATGSGDLALALAKACPDAEVLGADFCLPMLLAARRKAYAKLDVNRDGKLDFDEWSIKTTDRFAKADDDKSAGLTAEEFATTRIPRKAALPAPCVPESDG